MVIENAAKKIMHEQGQMMWKFSTYWGGTTFVIAVLAGVFFFIQGPDGADPSGTYARSWPWSPVFLAYGVFCITNIPSFVIMLVWSIAMSIFEFNHADELK